MQYQTQLNRQQLVDLAVNQYFASIARKDLEATLACCQHSALLTIQTSFALYEGKTGLRRFFAELFARYTSIKQRDFSCTVDAKNGRIAANYVEELVASDGARSVFDNTAFWRVREDRFQELFVYVSGAQPF